MKVYLIFFFFLKYCFCVFLFFPENSGLHVFDFLANSILKEVLSAIQKGKPGAFSPGRPTEFLKNYKSSLEFLAHLEGRIKYSSIIFFKFQTMELVLHVSSVTQ